MCFRQASFLPPLAGCQKYTFDGREAVDGGPCYEHSTHRHPGCAAARSDAVLVRDLSQGVEPADSDPVLAQQRYTLQRTRDDDDNTPRSSRQALAAGSSIRPFRAVRMKFNILNFILTDSSGPILLGSPDMERR